MDSFPPPLPESDQGQSSINWKAKFVRFSTLLGIILTAVGIFMLGFKSRELFSATAGTVGTVETSHKPPRPLSNIGKISIPKSKEDKSTKSQSARNEVFALTSNSLQNPSKVLDHLEKLNQQIPDKKIPTAGQPQQHLSTQLPQIQRNNNSLSNLSSSPSSIEPKVEQFPPLTLPTNQLPKLENNTQPNLRQSGTSQPAGVQLSLSDVVVLALQNNRDLKNAYLERIIQQGDLAVAEDKFIPNLIPAITVSMNRQALGSRGNNSGNLGLSANVSVKIPTGGTFNFGWNGTGQTFLANDENLDSLAQNLQLSFNQPLLRGSGIKVNQASIEIARFQEEFNILQLKSTLIETITSVILNYRNLLQAQEQLKIEQDSLEIAQRQLEILQALIDAGRQAQVDILPSQTNIANRQVSLLAAENNLEQARLELLKVLDLEENLNIIAAEDSLVISLPLDINNLKQLAFQNNPQYLQLLLNTEISKLDLLVAQDNRRWNLDLNASYGNSGTTLTDDTTDITVALGLSRDLGDRTLEQEYQRSRIRLLQAENNVIEERETLEIQVSDRFRDVNLKLRQVELARTARESAERQLEIEQEKLKLGRSDIINVVNFQNDLAQARNAELNARIEYANALTNLEQTVGITLENWKVTVEIE
jgi:outer membrane protein TolC